MDLRIIRRFHPVVKAALPACAQQTSMSSAPQTRFDSDIGQIFTTPSVMGFWQGPSQFNPLAGLPRSCQNWASVAFVLGPTYRRLASMVSR
jgi:hypothetical protein